MKWNKHNFFFSFTFGASVVAAGAGVVEGLEPAGAGDPALSLAVDGEESKKIATKIIIIKKKIWIK